MNLQDHKYLRLRRTLIDCSSAESRREGVMLYKPGRKWLRLLVVSCQWLVVSDFWFRILRFGLRMIGKLNLKTFDEILPGFDLEKALGCEVEYATIYTGNGSERSKFTLLVKISRIERVERVDNSRGEHRENKELSASAGSRVVDCDSVIVKVGNTKGAAEAIHQEAEALRRLSNVVSLRGCVPELLAEGTQGDWTWSAQTVLPRGYSPNKLQKEHFKFLEQLKAANISHGDFTPWNCSIVDGRLVVWDWEDAGEWVEGKDEAWFKKQLKGLMGIEI